MPVFRLEKTNKTLSTIIKNVMRGVPTVTCELVTVSVPPFWNCCCWNDMAGLCVDSFALF